MSALPVPVVDGRLQLRPAAVDAPRPPIDSPFEDWGEVDPAAMPADLELWEVVLVQGTIAHVVGMVQQHSVFYGPTAGSRAANIGVGVVTAWRRRGIGAWAQADLARLLHARGVVRVEASTDVANLAEQRALARAGFVCEGVLRGAQHRRDGRHDLQVWSHLPGDGAPAR